LAQRTIWITGASSGIGRSLAQLYAERGDAVAISARSAEALQSVAAGSANIHAYPLDITDPDAVSATAQQIAADHGPIDLAVLSAGVWSQMGIDEFDTAKIRKGMEVNFGGTINCVGAVIGPMMARRAGHIAIVASVAGYVGLPQSLAYGPTKAALISFAETLKPDLDRYGVGVSVVNPGFVETPMTAKNDFEMPYIMSAEDAAQRIATGLDRGNFEIAFPWQLVSSLKALRKLPYRLFFGVSRRMIEKREEQKRASAADSKS
jgi:short-subunit dehydrogenase